MPPTSSEVARAVKRLQARHHREASQRLTAVDLSLPQWDMLRHLDENPEASLHQLAELTYQTDQSAGSLAARMVQRGLLERLDGPGRAVRHRMTPHGDRVRQQGAELLAEVFAGTVGRLTEEQRAVLHDLLRRAATE